MRVEAWLRGVLASPQLGACCWMMSCISSSPNTDSAERRALQSGRSLPIAHRPTLVLRRRGCAAGGQAHARWYHSCGTQHSSPQYGACRRDENCEMPQARHTSSRGDGQDCGPLTDDDNDESGLHRSAFGLVTRPGKKFVNKEHCLAYTFVSPPRFPSQRGNP